MKDKEEGAIIIEATISLPIFMFAIITLLTIVNISLAQSKIGIAVNTTAKEISQYSYLYGLTGLNQKQADMYSETEGVRTNIENTISGVDGIFTSASEIGGTMSNVASNPSQIGGAFDSIKTSLDNGKGSLKGIQAELEDVASDPKEFILGSVKLFGNTAAEELKSRAIAAPLAKAFVKKHLVSSSDDNCERYLKYLGVVPSGGSYFNGLDFSDSVIFLNGSDEIKIIVNYDIQVIKLLGIDIKMSFTQCGATKAWFTGKSSS